MPQDFISLADSELFYSLELASFLIVIRESQLIIRHALSTALVNGLVQRITTKFYQLVETNNIGNEVDVKFLYAH